MKRIALALALLGCHDWSSLSDHYDDLSSCASRGPSACPSGASITCNGFDDQTALATNWNAPQDLNASSSVDSTCLFRGAASLHAISNGVAPGNTIRSDRAFVTSIPSDLFVRAYFKVSALPFDQMRLMEVPAPTGNIHLRVAGGALSVQNDFGTGGSTTVPFEANRWTCIELEVLRGASGVVRVWSDGAPVIDDPGAISNATAFDRVLVGPLVTATTNIPPLDVWIDEVAISNAPIGCL